MTLPPFDERVVSFCESLSQVLNDEKDPDLIVLAFWLRKSHIREMELFFKKKEGLLVPRGVVFHIPPSHIDVMLGYSIFISLLVGNSNIVRVPKGKNSTLLTLLKKVLKEFPLIETMIHFVEYAHEEEITKALSSQVDARIVWGGDDTVQKIRAIPLPPHAIDISFPDRFSFAVINGKNNPINTQVVQNFYNDVYWYDQLACSSPKLLFWVGDDAEEGSTSFYQTLQKVITKKKFQFPLNQVLFKKNHIFEKALTLPVVKITEYSNELTVLTLEKATHECRSHCGQGLIYHVPIKHLEEIANFTSHKDQTMTYYGFNESELQSLQRLLNGQGITRIVPFGQALNFEPVWDGQDLFSSLTQCNTLGVE